MKRSAILLALVLVFPALAQAPPRKPPRMEPVTPSGNPIAPGPALAPGDAAPELSGTTYGGESSRVRWDGSPLTVVNFWATWCVPCKSEMPLLQDLYSRRAKDGLAVWGVEVEPEPGAEHLVAARRFVSELKILYPVIRGAEDTWARWGGITILPTTFLVDRQGRIVRKYVGASPSETEGLVADVNALLDGHPLGTQRISPAETKPEGR